MILRYVRAITMLGSLMAGVLPIPFVVQQRARVTTLLFRGAQTQTNRKTTPDERTELPGTRTKMLASNRAVSNDAPCSSCIHARANPNHGFDSADYPTIFLTMNSTTATTTLHATMSTSKAVMSTRHGKYSGAKMSRNSQASGYPYHTAPTSMEGVLDMSPVKRVINTPPTTERMTILFAFMVFHVSSCYVHVR